VERSGRCLVWSNTSTSAYRNSGKHRITAIKTADIWTGIFNAEPHKYERRSTVTRPALGWRPAILTEFLWFTSTHRKVCLKCLKPDHGCFLSNSYLTIIIILSHTHTRQLPGGGGGWNMPNVGKAMHCLVHILLLLSLVVYHFYNTNVCFSRTCQGIKVRHFWQSLFYRISRRNFNGLCTAITNDRLQCSMYCISAIDIHSTQMRDSITWKKFISLPRSSVTLLIHIQFYL
jgi:hypothetical protein